MADLLATNLKIAQAKLIGKFASNEMRTISANTYKKIIEVTSIMMPDYMALRENESRAIEASFLVRAKRAVLTERSATHVGTIGDSSVITPLWGTSADVFADSLKLHGNNTVSRAEYISNQFENVYINIIESLEQDAQDFIFDGRTGVENSTGGGGTFDVTDDVYNFAQINVDTVVQKTRTVMEENGYNGRLTVFADSIAYDIFRKQAAQGTGNSTNLSFQFEGFDFVRSIGLGTKFGPLVGTYNTGVFIVIPEASVGALPWVPVENRQGVETKLQSYSTSVSPFDGVTMAVHTYPERVDGTAYNSETQDEKTQIEVSIDMAFVGTPITVVDETSFYAFSIQA